MDDEFTYDVAFSFLSQDEALADQLTDTLEGRLRIFHYARRQDLVAGTDGEATFNRVFGKEARVVVVLLRQGWGDRGMTLVEQTAIRNLAYASGYDFTLWIPLAGASVPPWVPKTRIWLSLDRWVIEGAAGVIEARATDLGAVLSNETAVEKAARLQRQQDREQERLSFLNSQAGVSAANAEIETLREALQTSAAELRIRAPSFAPQLEQQSDRFALQGGGATLTVAWSRHFSNSLRYSTLHVMFWPFAYSLQWQTDRPPGEKREYEFDLGPGEQRGWRRRNDRDRFYTSGLLADELLSELLDTPVAEDDWSEA